MTKKTAETETKSSTGRPPELIPPPICGSSAEEALAQRIFEWDDGRGLIKFCRELSNILIRNYSEFTDVGELRLKLQASIMVTLRCTEQQALSLIELSLELIHARVHGRYRRSGPDLTYLIASAMGSVAEVSSN